MAIIFPDDIRVGGNIQYTGTLKPDPPRSNLAQEPNVIFPVPFGEWRIWDSGQPLPASSAADDLALLVGTFGTDCPYLSTGDVKTLTVTRRARAVIALPAEYDAGETITVRVSGGMRTTIADGSATVDIEAYLLGRDSLVSGGDICTTAAQSINSLTFADLDFSITPTSRTAGDMLDVRLTIAVVDTATATAVTAAIGAVELLCDIRG